MRSLQDTLDTGATPPAAKVNRSNVDRQTNRVVRPDLRAKLHQGRLSGSQAVGTVPENTDHSNHTNISDYTMKISTLENQVSDFKNSFDNAWPFRHLVIDNFLEEELIEQVLADFPLPGAMDVHGTNSKRLLGWQISPRSPNYSLKQSINDLFDYLKSKRVRKVFSEIAGINSPLYSDPDYHGTGILLAPRGGVHRVHADRTFHPNPHVFPRLVFLLYFNKDWLPEYGGGLQLWDKKIKTSKTISPLFNRAVLFEITSTSYHSIEDVTCPENVYRRALNYYYLSDLAPQNSYVHDTIFYPRPGERLSYWKDIATTNFPVQLIGTIASRSSIARKIHSTVRSLIKGPRKMTNLDQASEETKKRWEDFNEMG